MGVEPIAHAGMLLGGAERTPAAQIEALIGSSAAFDDLYASTRAFTDLRIPLFSGRRAAQANAVPYIEGALGHARRAVELLRASGHGEPTARVIEGAQRALQHIGARPAKGDLNAVTGKVETMSSIVRRAISGDLLEMVRTSPEEAVREVVDSILSKQVVDVTKAEWVALDAANARVGMRNMPVPRDIFGAPTFRSLVHEVAAGRAQAREPLQQYFDAAVAMRTPIGDLQRTADAILAKDVEAITQEEWRTLRTLIDIDVDSSIVPMPRRLLANPELRRAVGSMAGEPGLQRIGALKEYWSELRASQVPEANARREQAVAAVASGSLDRAAQRQIAMDMPRFGRMVQERPVSEQARLALAAIGSLDVVGGEQLLRALKVLDGYLDSVLDTRDELPFNLVVQAVDVQAVLDRNIRRMEGTASRELRKGFLNYPDHGELGRIQGRIEFLLEMTSGIVE